VTIDLLRLAKMLELSRSNNDHEALSAIRMANGVLNKHNATWLSLLAGQAYKAKSEPKPKARRFGATCDEHVVSMLFKLRNYTIDIQERDLAFVESVDTYWRDHGRLTERQLWTLEDIWNRYYKGETP
jgi:hypothetical protein